MKNSLNEILELSNDDFVKWIKIILSELKEKRQNEKIRNKNSRWYLGKDMGNTFKRKKIISENNNGIDRKRIR